MILSWGDLTGGTQLTADECRKAGKPHLIIDLARSADIVKAVLAARTWIKASVSEGVLNVAGPRASEHTSVYDAARAYLLVVLGGEG
jgi:hypothetical protein